MGQASMGVADWQLDEVDLQSLTGCVESVDAAVTTGTESLAGWGQRRGGRGSSAIEPPTMLSSLCITARSKPSPPWCAFKHTPWHLG
jgi:hypothetical protein